MLDLTVRALESARMRAFGLLLALSIPLLLAGSPARADVPDDGPTIGAAPAPRIEGGTVIDGLTTPSAVYLVRGANTCSGSLIAADLVLTAAHCVVSNGTAVDPTTIKAWLGFKGVVGGKMTFEQAISGSTLRVHPSYDPAPTVSPYDVAVLRLSSAADLTRTYIETVALPTATPVADDEQRTLSGFGRQSAGKDGTLRTLTWVDDRPEDCTIADAAVTNCAHAPAGQACPGDSGGGVIVSRPTGPVVVGVMRSVVLPCTAGNFMAYTDVTAPAVLAFVSGSDTPPEAPIQATRTGSLDIRGLTVTCVANTWTGAPVLDFAFRPVGATTPLQFGASNTTRAPAGTKLECFVRAKNAGGTGLARVATSNELVPLTPSVHLTATTSAAKTFAYDFAGPPENPNLRAEVRRAGTATTSRPLAAGNGTFPGPTGPGRFDVCVVSDAVGDFAASSACLTITRGGLATHVSKAVWKARTGRTRSIRLSTTATVKQPARITWQLRPCSRCSVRRSVRRSTTLRPGSKRAFTSPVVPRGYALTVSVRWSAIVDGGVPYSAATKSLK